jgi:hypothetical protein
MPLFAKMRSLLRNLWCAQHVDKDADEEVRTHLEMLREENARAGWRRTRREGLRSSNLVALSG